MRHLTILIAMLLLAGNVSAAQCTTLHDGKTMSYWANQGNQTAVGILIDGGCDANSTSRVTPDGPLLTPLQASAISSASTRTGVIRWLVKEKQANVDLKDPVGRTPLMMAVAAGNLRSARYLIASGASLDATESDSGKTALMLAQNDVAFALLTYSGADINMATSGGLMAWHTAALHFNRAYIVDLLIAQGAKAKIDAFADTKYSALWGGRASPLMLAAAQSQTSTFLHRLIVHGAKIDASHSDSHRTAIYYAARWGHIDNVRMLIRAGADVNAGRKRPGATFHPIFAAVVGAKSIDRTQVVKELIAAGGQVTDSFGFKPSVPDDYIDSATLKTIIANPKPYWPVRAYALGIPFNPPAPDALATASQLDIGCHEASGSCLVYFDCTDTVGAKTGNATLSAGATVTYSDSASSPNTTTIAGQLGLESDERWNGMLDCALRSRQKITAQVWSRTGTTLANNTDYIRSDENHEAILQKVHPQASSQRMAVRIRCIDETDCKNTVVKCRSAAGTTASNMSIDVGKIDRVKTKTLYNYARGDDASDFPAGIASCGVRSKGAFLVQILTNSGGTLINQTGIGGE